MRENRPSATAQRVAMRRAAHQILDDPKVFDDPLATRIVGLEKASTSPDDPLRNESTRTERHLRAFVAARSRFAEDRLALAFQRGVSQYVILGAGLDTFAYRNPYPRGALRVFEVDYPATQALKRARLEETGIAIPSDLTFAPVDFETQTLAEGLRLAGFDPGQRTFFSWLGVSMYLTTDALHRTLRFIAASPVGSEVVFDYAISLSLLSPTARAFCDALMKRVSSAEEPWQAFYDPQAFRNDLLALGFAHVEDITPEDINASYFLDRIDGPRVGSLAHIMSARV